MFNWFKSNKNYVKIYSDGKIEIGPSNDVSEINKIMMMIVNVNTPFLTSLGTLFAQKFKNHPDFLKVLDTWRQSKVEEEQQIKDSLNQINRPAIHPLDGWKIK